MTTKLIPIADHPDLADRIDALIDNAWPAFMLQDPIADQHWNRLYSTFGDCQVALVEGEHVIGQGNTIPID